VEQTCDVDGEPEQSPLFEWTPRPGRPFHARLYRWGDAYRFWVNDMGWFHIDPAKPSIAMPKSGDPLLLEERLWGIPAALCLLGRGDLPVHAAAVDVGGAAVLLAAPGRFGKTTLVSAFMEAGHAVLAEDLTCCRVQDRPVVVPGPAMLRVRKDSYRRLQIKRAAVVGEDDERYHLAIDPALRGDSAPLPIRCVLFLHWGPEGDAVRLQPIAAEEAVRRLWSVAFHFPVDEVRAQCFEQIAGLAAEVELFHLHRPKDYARLGSTVEQVVAACHR
jgi:hypothetical protein